MKTVTVLRLCIAWLLIILVNEPGIFAQNTGVPDPNFGTAGQVLTKIAASRDDISQSVAIQSDGKIVVAGNSFNLIGYSNIGVIRYKANGKADKTFNSTGKKVINNSFCNVVAVQSDGKIVVGGSKAIGSSTVFDLWRLNANGTVDNTFGTSGEQTVSFSGYVICFAMTIQPDGKILIAGNDGNFYAGNSSMVIARLTTAGQLDNTFSGDGKYSFNLTKKSLDCQKILLQPDGKIIAVGNLDTIVDPYFRNEFFATRLNADGTLDNSFGVNGVFRKKNSNSDNCYGGGLLPDGRFVIAGFSQFTGYNTSSVLCVNSNGTVDNTFGTNGWYYCDFLGSNNPVIYSVAIQTNGKIILAGNVSYVPSYVNAIGLARLNGNGTLDPSFGSNGIDTSFASAWGAIGCNDMILQSDGKIVITGYKLQSHDYFMTARYLNGQQLEKVYAVPDEIAVSELRLFPVPVNGSILNLVFKLSEHSEVVVHVYDLNGQEVRAPEKFVCETGTITEAITLPKELKNGTYICTVSAGGLISSQQFQVER